MTSNNNLMVAVDEEIENYKENQLDQSVEMGVIQASYPYCREYQQVLPTSAQENCKLIQYDANSQRSIPMRMGYNSIMVYYLVKRFLTKLSLGRRQKLFFKSQHFQIVGDKASQKNESLGELLHKKRINTLKQKQLKFFKKVSDQFIAAIYNFQRQLPIIYPQSISKIIIDILVCIVTVCFLIIIPLDLAFNIYLMHQDAAGVTILFLIFLTFNYFVKMNTVYFENGQPIEDKGQIFLNYLKNGLIIDGLTILVLAFGFINSNYIKSQIAQLIQLIFLTQFPYFSKIIRNIEESIHMSKTQSALLNLAKLILTLLYFLHIFSCCWFFIGDYMHNQGEANWLDFRELGNSKAIEQYLDAFYFSTVTMISVGYGDIVPQNYLEKLCTIIFMFTTCIQLSFSVNTVGEILNSITLSSENTTEKVRIINKFMNRKKIRFDLQYQIREYIKIYWSHQLKEESDEEQILIQSLSENLRNQLIYESNNATIENCKLFRDTFSHETQIQLVQLLKTVFIQPEQYITSELPQFGEQCLCFIEEGELNLFSKDSDHSQIVRFEKGQYFGLDELLTGTKPHLQLKSQSFVKLQVLVRSEFLQTVSKNSKDYEHFCRIRDQLQLQEIESKTKCLSCNCNGHDIWNCPIVHYVADKERVIKKHQFLQNQERRHIIRPERQKNLFSALSDQWLLSEISHAFQNQSDSPLVKFYNMGVMKTMQIQIPDSPQKSQDKSPKVNFLGQIPFALKNDKGIHRRMFRHGSIKVKNSTIRLKFQKIVKKLIKINQVSRNFWALKNEENPEKQFNEMILNQVKEYFQSPQIEDNLSKSEFENLYFLRIKGELDGKDYQQLQQFEIQKEYQSYFTHNNLMKVIPKYESQDLRSSLTCVMTRHHKSPYLPPDMLYNALKKSLIHYLQFPILYFEKFNKIRSQDKKKTPQLKVKSTRALFQKYKSQTRRLMRRQNALPENVKIGRIVPQRQ